MIYFLFVQKFSKDDHSEKNIQFAGSKSDNGGDMFMPAAPQEHLLKHL